jgi:dihydrodipicolinate synthase/N-acetylneuraminate lyase
MTASFQGVFPAAITPRRADSAAIDFSAALELFDFLEAKGCDGITLLGSTGEFLHFSLEDRTRLVMMASKRNSLPLLVNVSHSTLEGSVQLAQEAMDAGASGVLIMPPYFFRYSQELIRAFCLEFAERVKPPVYLYNIPFFTSELELQTSLDLLSTGAFAGIKDSGGKWEHFEALQNLAAGRDLAILMGSDGMYSRACRAGAAGAVSGAANALPELMVGIDRRARAGQDTAALDALLSEFLTRAMSFAFPVAFREAAAIRGIAVGPHATPLSPGEFHRLADFHSWFQDWWPDTAKLPF